MKNQEALKRQGDVIWNIANLLRGPYRPPQYRRVMIPLTVLRRLDCVLEASKDEVLAHYQHLLKVGKYNEEAIDKMINRKFGLNFHNTSAFKDKARIQEEVLVGQAAQAAILAVLESMKTAFPDGELIKDRADFDQELSATFDAADLPLDASLKAALLAPGALGEKDPRAEPCRNKKGELEPDADLRDTETVPLPAGIALPLPLDYENKKNKGKLDLDPLLKLVRQSCEAYLQAEVLPYRPDAWIDHQKTKVGFEIPFNRHFYEYKPPRPLAAIEKDIANLEHDIVALLKEVTA